MLVLCSLCIRLAGQSCQLWARQSFLWWTTVPQFYGEPLKLWESIETYFLVSIMIYQVFWQLEILFGCVATLTLLAQSCFDVKLHEQCCLDFSRTELVKKISLFSTSVDYANSATTGTARTGLPWCRNTLAELSWLVQKLTRFYLYLSLLGQGCLNV